MHARVDTYIHNATYTRTSTYSQLYNILCKVFTSITLHVRNCYRDTIACGTCSNLLEAGLTGG